MHRENLIKSRKSQEVIVLPDIRHNSTNNLLKNLQKQMINSQIITK